MANTPLSPINVIEGASVRGHNGLYVLGCYDHRITFYSQQVRAIALIHALAEQEHLRNNPRIAVIGGGAAGTAAAAAAALACNGEVVIFEAASDLLKLQMGTDRRKLDPHLYNWPQSNSDDPVADLPILGWDAGPSAEVRGEVVRQFEEICGRAQNLVQKKRHKVNSINKINDGDYTLSVFDIAANQERPESFGIVILAFGFGLEATETIAGIGDKSYWDNAGVPGTEFRGRAQPHYFVSGSGDGGLIDFVASAIANFDHATLIQDITNNPDRRALEIELLSIENDACQAKERGDPFDLFSSYNARITPLIEGSGLVARISLQLRPGVRLTLQTRDETVFSLGSAILNRLAAFATIRACLTTEGHDFQHLACESVERVNGFVAEPDGPTYQLNCDGEVIVADEVIIRRGTFRDGVRGPFTALLGSHQQQHEEWLARLGEAALVPVLSAEAQDYFRSKARDANIIGSLRRINFAAAAMPITVHLSRDGADIRWSSDRAPAQVSDAWEDGNAFDVTLAQGPADIGPVGGAMLRVATHAPQATVHAAPLDWSEPWKLLTSRSQHAGGILMPSIVGDNPGGAWNPREITSSTRLARNVHRSLDQWVLAKINAHLSDFFVNEDDPGGYIGLEIAADLRALMQETWRGWHEAFMDEPPLLARFLRLVVCATDDEGDAVQVLVGPRKLPAMIGGTALSLAIAAVWGDTTPSDGHSGNLLRQIPGDERTGHGCAPDRILGKRSSICAETHSWQTKFVLLALEGRLELARKAEEPFASVGGDQPSLTETTGSGPMMMWISHELVDALNQGTDALRTFLEDIERRHEEPLLNAIERLEPAT